MNIVALIPARGGSKGLPRKNIIKLDGKPLIEWTIEAALSSNLITEVYVSTEDAEILQLSCEMGTKCINRPTELATDTATSESVIEHAIEILTRKGVLVDILVLLQPTSPLRTAFHIDEALKMLLDRNSKMVVSVFEPSHTPIKAYILNEYGELKGLFHDEAPYSRRQDLPPSYQPNGAIYGFRVDEFNKTKQLPRNGVIPYIMSLEESADIDTLDDLLKIETYLRKNNA